jgi:hypothetical protein
MLPIKQRLLPRGYRLDAIKCYMWAPQLLQRLSRISRQQSRPIGKKKIAKQMPQQEKLSVA